ncbi:HET-domain-containing protein [Ophiobolus disseminans]|uniref:HET-domain-containing protein n=1 Tax=Ophiobolus disseminans TaxID=1469910 RepID=A0A6A7AJS0_9PLEO|nr:HET-domain-containing protein [Ophiobolus disseminans]
MRLLQFQGAGSFSVVEFQGNNVPPYAILSHTWGPSNEEVTYQDLLNSTGKDKSGYRKLTFCRQRAAEDGLYYFWIDTCCINKDSSAELSEAINSMFRWYHEAVKCYAYLSDVSTIGSTGGSVTFQESRWFTRGWTLQELLAPKSVEFFSTEGDLLGSKSSRVKAIARITGISTEALLGRAMSQFSVEERMAWASRRETTREEDIAYSLFGMFDIHMPLIYGEGKEKALRRLRKEIRELSGDTAASLSQNTQNRSLTQDMTPTYYIPFLKNRYFVGRRDELYVLKQKLIVDCNCQKMSIVGLGGTGKTQVALQFAYIVKETWPEYSIFWMPALSMESFDQACADVARRLHIPLAVGEEGAAKELVKQHLSAGRTGRWLLVLDNADDAEILFGAGQSKGIVDYLPESEEGVTVYTTRTLDVAVSLTRGDVIELRAMDRQDAKDFLKKSLIRKDLLCNGAATTELLDELTCLPLAIAQAAAYLNMNRVSIAKYLKLLRNTEQDIVGVMSREFRDNTRYEGLANAVATTWMVSFSQVQARNAAAADLLAYMSRIEWKAIPQSLLPSVQSEERLEDAMGTLCGYSFLTRRETDKQEGREEAEAEEEWYDMHRLVHLATRIWIRKYSNAAEVTERAVGHTASVFPSDDYANRAVWRAYLPHALQLLESKPDCGWQNPRGSEVARGVLPAEGPA